MREVHAVLAVLVVSSFAAAWVILAWLAIRTMSLLPVVRR
jgi:hypothetical protein